MFLPLNDTYSKYINKQIQITDGEPMFALCNGVIFTDDISFDPACRG